MGENRLLTEQECYQATIAYAHRLGRKVSRGTHAGDEALCKAQDAKTASIKDAEFKKKCKECEYDPQAAEFGWFLEHGWTPPEKAGKPYRFKKGEKHNAKDEY